MYDQVLVSLLRNWHQFVRNAIFSFGRLGILLLAAAVLAPIGMVIYGAWLLATAASLAVVAVMARRHHLLAESGPLQWRHLSTMAFSAMSHHVLNLSRSASIWLLPIIVTVAISREANAAFYVALLLANFIAIVGTSATFTLFVVSARSPDQLWRQIRFTLALSALAATIGTMALALLGPYLLGAFGASYASAAYPAVVVLAAATLPLVVKDHWIALQRIHDARSAGLPRSASPSWRSSSSPRQQAQRRLGCSGWPSHASRSSRPRRW